MKLRDARKLRLLEIAPAPRRLRRRRRHRRFGRVAAARNAEDWPRAPPPPPLSPPLPPPGRRRRLPIRRRSPLPPLRHRPRRLLPDSQIVDPTCAVGSSCCSTPHSNTRSADYRRPCLITLANGTYEIDPRRQRFRREHHGERGAAHREGGAELVSTNLGAAAARQCRCAAADAAAAPPRPARSGCAEANPPSQPPRRKGRDLRW